MASGIDVNDEGIQEFQKMKTKSTKGASNTNPARKVLIYKIDKTVNQANNKETNLITLDNDLEEQWDTESKGKAEDVEFMKKFLCDNLRDDACRYVFVDRPVQKKPGLTKSDDITMITWAPDSAPIKEKMLISSSKGNFKRCLGIDCSDKSCADKAELEEKMDE